MTDHSTIQLKVNLIKYNRGPGFWKFNCSLLSDEDFKEGIQSTISRTVVENPNTDPGLLWDTIKLNIRGFCIRYSARKKRSETNIISALEKRLCNLEQRLHSTFQEYIPNEIAQIKSDIENIVIKKLAGSIIRSRVQWVEQGEKPTKFFLDLEKRNYETKCINSLKLSDGSTVYNTKDILNEQLRFYTELYTTNGYDDIYENEFFDLNAPSLTEVETMTLDRVITEADLLEAIKSSPKNKSPGSDGLPIEFYCTFWDSLKNYMLKFVHHSFVTGNLPLTCRQGIITLLPKKDKNRSLLKNWRPLSLLNCDYKCIAKIIAFRIKTILPKIINNDQTGFMKGRFIGENIVKLLDIMEFAEKN